MATNQAEAQSQRQTQPLLIEDGDVTDLPKEDARPRGLRAVAMGAAALVIGSLGLAAVMWHQPQGTPVQDVGQKVELLSDCDNKSHPCLRPLPKAPIMPTLAPRARCAKLCGLVNPCRADCAGEAMKCLSAKRPVVECTEESNTCQTACTATHNRDANCLTNCVMSNGKSLSGSLSGYLNRVKERARDNFRDAVNRAVDNIWQNRDEIIETAWENRDEIIETTRGKVEDKMDDITKIVEDIIRGKAGRQISDTWKNRGEIIESTRDRVEGITLAAHDELKNAVKDSNGIQHAIRGQFNYQRNHIWKKRDEIMKTTGIKVKDITILAEDKLKNPEDDAEGVKDIWTKHDDIAATTGKEVKDITNAARDGIKNAAANGINDAIKDRVQTDKIWRNHDGIMKTTENKVKDVTNMAQDQLTGSKVKDVTDVAQEKLKKADASVKDQVTDRIDKVWDSRESVIKTTGAEVKNMAKRAQDELGFRINM